MDDEIAVGGWMMRLLWVGGRDGCGWTDDEIAVSGWMMRLL